MLARLKAVRNCSLSLLGTKEIRDDLDLLLDEDCEFFEEAEKADIFNKCFCSLFSKEQNEKRRKKHFLNH